MNSDIRLSIGWNRNPKIVKLRRKLGADGVLGLISIWTFAGEQRPDGILSGMDVDDIAIVAEYPGESVRFVTVLSELGLIEKIGNDWAIHDWEANNPWAFGFKARSEKAKKAIQARWERRNNPSPDPGKSSKNTTSMENHTTSIEKQPPSNTPFLSSPFLSSPSPNSKDMILTDHGETDVPPPAAKVVHMDATPYTAILDAYHAELPMLRKVCKLTPARKSAIRSAWRGDLLGVGLEHWREFFGYIRDDCPFLTGQKPGKDGHTFEADLEWLMKPANLVKIVEGKYEEGARHG